MRVVCFNRDSHMNLPPNPGHFIHRDLGKYRYCQYLFCRLINMSRTADANAVGYAGIIWKPFSACYDPNNREIDLVIERIAIR